LDSVLEHGNFLNTEFPQGSVATPLQRGGIFNKKHLKNVGPIRHNEPPHAHSPDVASGTVARRLRIDVHDNDDNDNACSA